MSLGDIAVGNRLMNHAAIAGLEHWLSQQIIGQADLVRKLLIAVLADGHLLVEGAPGLAKTRAIKMLAEGVEGDFHRVQFTPDLLPGDITGTDIFRPQMGTFEFQAGPIFHNLVLPLQRLANGRTRDAEALCQIAFNQPITWFKNPHINRL